MGAFNAGASLDPSGVVFLIAVAVVAWLYFKR